ncbi:MAG: hypothetical protein FWD53_06240, partial [Phycisphaerales bacterium]|nr:hypothetical protein [Phycisphaerales bacterium]
RVRRLAGRMLWILGSLAVSIANLFECDWTVVESAAKAIWAPWMESSSVVAERERGWLRSWRLANVT